MKVAWDANDYPSYEVWLQDQIANSNGDRRLFTSTSHWGIARNRWYQNKRALPQFKRDIETMIFTRANFASKAKTAIRMTSDDIRKWLIEELEKDVKE